MRRGSPSLDASLTNRVEKNALRSGSTMLKPTAAAAHVSVSE
jgi:hypothetical protein